MYNLKEGSLHEKFLNSRAKIQMFGGGFGNGKSACMCIKVLNVARDYPGANILMARSTLKKLNDTLRVEFTKWCPPEWIKSFPKPMDDSTICTLHNGTTINFRYIAQQGKAKGESTSNLLSATYDLICVDQMEDPEITYKDFIDLLGRLRGSTKYDPPMDAWDDTMPVGGTRWFLIGCNPTRNWVYRKLVKPLEIYHKSEGQVRSPDLIVNPKTLEPLVELIEGSTYTNKDNLPEDFIMTLEASYKGSMKTRFLEGKWSAYDGLVFPTYEYETHVVPHKRVVQYFYDLLEAGMIPTILEGFDYGIASPSCYLLGFADHKGNVFVLDGFYHNNQSKLGIKHLATMIKEKRELYGVDDNAAVRADPSIFKRSGGAKNGAGATVAELFEDEGVSMVRGSNQIIANVTKIQGYLDVDEWHKHPIDKSMGSPHLFISSELEFLDNEISDYYWKADNNDEKVDKPMDKKDHAINSLEYMLTDKPALAKLKRKTHDNQPYMVWSEVEIETAGSRSARHA